MALTKADMAERLFEELGLNKREAKELVEMFFEEVRDALENGQQVKLSGFGNFDLRDKKQRPGRNPTLGVLVTQVATVRRRFGDQFSAVNFGMHVEVVGVDTECPFRDQQVGNDDPGALMPIT